MNMKKRFTIPQLNNYSDHWTGMVEHVRTGLADLSAAGFTVTLERSAVVDYSLIVATFRNVLFVATPSGEGKLSFQNYL